MVSRTKKSNHMIPTVGFYLLMHILVIFFKKILLFAKNNLVSSLIIIGVILGVSISVVTAVDTATNDSSNIHYYKSFFSECEPVKQTYNPKKIIIRIDDIQAFWLNDLQVKMLNELKSRDIPALLGVIPINLSNDRKISNYLKSNNCRFEIALHGWDQGKESGYTIPEFGSLNENEAREKILKGKNELKDINSQLTTFIPPNNKYSLGTKKALLEEGFKIISSEGDNIFDYSASSYNFADSNLASLDNVLNECKLALKERNLCMIMLHPQDYITKGELDPIKYNSFLETLDALENLDAMFTTAEDLEIGVNSIKLIDNTNFDLLKIFIASSHLRP